jgi:hypothetical protein
MIDLILALFICLMGLSMIFLMGIGSIIESKKLMIISVVPFVIFCLTIFGVIFMNS